MRVVKSEKRSWMALWQLRRVPRRITQAPHTADCQQGHREAPWMEIHNHTTTHTNMHRDTQTYCSRCLPCRILMSVSPVSCPPLFYQVLLFFPLPFSFIPLLPAYSPPTFFSLSLHLYHSLHSLPQAAGRGEAWLGLHQTGNICCILRLLEQLFLLCSKISRRRHSSTFLSAHSFHLLAIYLFIST